MWWARGIRIDRRRIKDDLRAAGERGPDLEVGLKSLSGPGIVGPGVTAVAGETSTDWVPAPRRDRRPPAARPGGEVMNRPGRGLRRAAAVGFVLAVAASTLAGPARAGTQAAAHGPVVKLIVAQNNITLPSFRGRVFLDPGVYVGSLGSALQFDVQRASYTKPI